MPRAEITFGIFPEGVVSEDDEDATDGTGAIIVAEPGEGLMVFGPVVNATSAALYSCSVKADKPYISVTLASVDMGANGFVTTTSPSNSAFFVEKFQVLNDFFIPPSIGFQPLIQIVNTSETETVTVYLDNMDVWFLDPTPAIQSLPSLLILLAPLIKAFNVDLFSGLFLIRIGINECFLL